MAASNLTLYTSAQSQWARVAHLGLEEKGFREDEYTTHWINLVAAENFAPTYVDVNPQATVPSLRSSSLQEPFVDSVPILEHLDRLRPSASVQLTPGHADTRDQMDRLISLVHSDKMSTNLILLGARSTTEMREKQTSIWKQFVSNRQDTLSRLVSSSTVHTAFYLSKLDENSKIYDLYTSQEVTGPKFNEFYKQSVEGYKSLVHGLNQLDELLVLPYATGDDLTYADLHIAPWLSHAMWGAGASEILDFEPLEVLIGQSVEDFKVGNRIREWWKNMSARPAFQKVYPTLA